MLSAGVVAYLGSFTMAYRAKCINQWSTRLLDAGISCSTDFQLSEVLGNPVTIRSWTIAGLPNDPFSIDNAINLQYSGRWPLMIDPQMQANKWIRRTEQLRAANDADEGGTGNSLLFTVRMNAKDFVRVVENSVCFGKILLIENVGEIIDPILEPILKKQIVVQGGMATVQVGENAVDYDQNFKLFITTKLPNPHYPPEICVQVNLLNFVATPEGLEDQMLGIAIKNEAAELEEERERLVLQDADNKKQLKEIEDTILKLLDAAEGNILDDEVLVNTLSSSKAISNEIEIKVKEAEKTAAKIEKTRAGYRPVAFRASQLYFCIADLGSVDPMYQYSLEWYINLYTLSFGKARPSSELEERLKNLNTTLTYSVYCNVCRSLFEKDKMLFSFLLCSKILLGRGDLDAQEFRFSLTGTTSLKVDTPNPCENWLPDKVWADLCGLAKLEAFESLPNEVVANPEQWKHVIKCVDPIVEIAKLCKGDNGESVACVYFRSYSYVLDQCDPSAHDSLLAICCAPPAQSHHASTITSRSVFCDASALTRLMLPLRRSSRRTWVKSLLNRPVPSWRMCTQTPTS